MQSDFLTTFIPKLMQYWPWATVDIVADNGNCLSLKVTVNLPGLQSANHRAYVYRNTFNRIAGAGLMDEAIRYLEAEVERAVVKCVTEIWDTAQECEGNNA